MNGVGRNNECYTCLYDSYLCNKLLFEMTKEKSECIIMSTCLGEYAYM